MPTAADVSRLLKLDLVVADFSSFVPYIRSGFSRKCFDEFLSGTTIASRVMQLAAFKGLAEDAKELSPEASDCLLRIARIYAEALELFDDNMEAAEWLVTNNLALEDQTPLELLDTTIGFELVFNELKRLQYGIAG